MEEEFHYTEKETFFKLMKTVNEFEIDISNKLKNNGLIKRFLSTEVKQIFDFQLIIKLFKNPVEIYVDNYGFYILLIMMVIKITVLKCLLQYQKKMNDFQMKFLMLNFMVINLRMF